MARSYQTRVRHAAASVHGGAVIAYPTEAVWGLGCDPWNAQAVSRLLRIKMRDWRMGLIVVASSMEQLEGLLAPLPEAMLSRLRSTWPGPVTWLIPDEARHFPAWIRGRHRSVAVRVSNHALTRALCEACAMPLVSTSANRSGRKPCLNAVSVRREFARRAGPDLLLAGPLGGNAKPSEIRDLASGRILRAG